MGILTVFLDKVTNLQDEDHFGGKSDPYVKFELEQDNLIFDKDYGDQKSSKKNDTQDPVYEETFTWEIPTLENMELTIKVMDDDFGPDEELGKCKIKLEDLDLGPDPVGVDRVVDHNIFSKDARIYLTIAYTEE